MQQRTKAPCRRNSHGATVGVGRDQLGFGKQTSLGSVRPQTRRAAHPLSLSLSPRARLAVQCPHRWESGCVVGAGSGRRVRTRGGGRGAWALGRKQVSVCTDGQRESMSEPRPLSSSASPPGRVRGSPEQRSRERKMRLEALGAGSKEEPGRDRPTWRGWGRAGGSE